MKPNPILVAAILFCMAGASARATVYTYTPTSATTDQWAAGTNWSAVPVSASITELKFIGTNTTVFSNSIANTDTNNIGAFQLNILDLQGTGPASGAGTITINSSASNSLNFVSSSGTTPVVNLNALSGTAGLTYKVGSNLTLTNNTLFTGNGTATFNITGVISGGGTLSKSGSSTLTLSGSNSYSGGTVLSTGTLAVGNNKALGTNALTFSAGTLQASTSGITLSNAVSLSGTGTIGGTNNLTLGGSFTNSTGNNTLTVNNSGSTTLSGSVYLSELSGTGRTFTVNGTGKEIISGVIANFNGSGLAGGLTYSGSGTLTLSNANTYSGVTTISSGVLSTNQLTSEGAGGGVASGIGASGNAASNLVLDGGTLQYTGALQSADRLFTLTKNGGSIDASGSDALTFSNTGAVAFTGTNARTLTLTGTSTTANTLTPIIGDNTGATTLAKTGTGTWALAGANTYTGVTTISGGVLSVSQMATEGTGGGVASSIGASGNAASNLVLNGATFQYNGAIQSTDRLFTLTNSGGTLDASGSGALTFSNTGAIAFTGTNARTLTLTGTSTAANTLTSIIGDNTGATALTKSSSGNWVLAGANTYTGVTTLSGGVLSVSQLATEGAGGGVSSGIGASGNAASNLVLDGGTLQYTGAVQSTDRLFTLTNNGGTIDASGSGALTFGNVGSIASTGTNTRTLTLTGTSTASNTFTSIIADNSGVTSLSKTGTGKWVLSGANTYSGGTTITGGTLLMGGNETLGNPDGTYYQLNVSISGAGSTLDLGSTTQGVVSNPSQFSVTLSNGATIQSTGGGGSLGRGDSFGKVYVSGLNNAIIGGVTLYAALQLGGSVNTPASLTLDGTLNGPVSMGNATLNGTGVVTDGIQITEGTINSVGTFFTEALDILGDSTFHAVTLISGDTFIVGTGGTAVGAYGINQIGYSSLIINAPVVGNLSVDLNCTVSGTGSINFVYLSGNDTVSSSGTLTTAGIEVGPFYGNNLISSGTVTGNFIQDTSSGLIIDGTATGSDKLTGGASLSGIGSVGAVTLSSDGNTLSSAGTLTIASLTTVTNPLVALSGIKNQISSGTVNATGGTNVNASTSLAVNGTLSGGAVAVSGLLGGSGTVTAPVTVNSGGATLPGVSGSPAKLTLDLSYNASSSAQFVVNSTTTADSPRKVKAGTDHDQIVVTGASNPVLTIGTAGSSIQGDGTSNSNVQLQLNFGTGALATLQSHAATYSTATGNVSLNNYFLFQLGTGTSAGYFQTLALNISGTNYLGTISYSGANDPFNGTQQLGYVMVTGLPGAQTTLELAISYAGNAATNSTTGGNDIVATAILHPTPEPSTWMLLAMGGAGLLALRYRRWKIPQSHIAACSARAFYFNKSATTFC